RPGAACTGVDASGTARTNADRSGAANRDVVGFIAKTSASSRRECRTMLSASSRTPGTAPRMLCGLTAAQDGHCDAVRSPRMKQSVLKESRSRASTRLRRRLMLIQHAHADGAVDRAQICQQPLALAAHHVGFQHDVADLRICLQVLRQDVDA